MPTYDICLETADPRIWLHKADKAKLLFTGRLFLQIKLIDTVKAGPKFKSALSFSISDYWLICCWCVLISSRERN